jgi:urease accessory protein
MTALPPDPVLPATDPPAPIMADPAALLSLVQWLSPAFPTGSFAYSHWLEMAIAAGEVASPAALAQWVADVLAHGAGRTDAVLLAHALRPDADHAALAALACALAPTAERLQETAELGAALTRTTNALNRTDHPPAPLPVALGRAAAQLSLPPELVLGLYLQSFAGTLILAAVRFMPMGQTEGQMILAGLAPLCLRLAGQAAQAPLSAIGSAAIRADIASARHETLDVRIFRT